MTWLKLDDNFFGDPKVVAAGRDARDMFLAALTYSSRHLTDGRIPAGALARIAADAEVSNEQLLAGRLVEVGLWAPEGGDFVVPKYLKYNPSSEQVKAERDAARQRKAHRSMVRPNSGRTPAELGENGRPESGRSSASPSPVDPVPSPVDPVVAPDGASVARTAEPIDEEFKSALEDAFWEDIGSREAVRDSIAKALSHKSRGNFADQRAYLRSWLRDDAQRALSRRPTAARNGHSPPPSSRLGAQALSELPRGRVIGGSP